MCVTGTVNFKIELLIIVVLYRYETLSLTLGEECRLRVFKNRILKRIFGSRRNENEVWRKVYNAELHSLNRFREIESRKLRWTDHITRMEEGRSAFTGKPTGKRPLGKPRRRWEDNIRMNEELG